MNSHVFSDVVVYLSSSLSVIIFLVNAVCITVILKTKELRHRSASIFIVNLLVTHLLQGLIVLPIYAVKKAKNYPREFYPLICDTWRLTYMLTFYGTCINVLLVAVDRFIVTKYALTQKIKLTSKHCVWICCFSWFYMLALCLIPFTPIKRTISLQNSTCHYNQPKEWTIFMLTANCFLPFVLVSAMYVYIVAEIKRSNRISKGVDATTAKSMSNNHKLTWLTIKITLTYGLTWLPSIVYYSIVVIAPELLGAEFYVSDAETVLTFLLKYVTFFDAVLAPILYCCNSQDFKKAFKRLRLFSSTVNVYHINGN